MRALLAIGDIKVIALVRDSEKAKKIYGDLIGNSLKLHIADIVDKIKIEDAVDYIFHCASITASKMMIEKPGETLLISVEGILHRRKSVLRWSIFHRWKFTGHLMRAKK